MKEPLHHYMKPGIVHYRAFPEVLGAEGPVLETLMMIANDDFFHAIEIGPIRDDKVRQQAAYLLESSGLDVYWAAQPVLLGRKLDLGAVEKQTREEAIETLEACIREARTMNARGIGIVSGTDPGERERPAATERMINSIKQVCDYAAQTDNMPVLLEAHDRQPFAKNCLIGPTQEAFMVWEQVYQYYPYFGMTLDLSRLPLLNETAEQAIANTQKGLASVHVGNCLINDPSHEAYGDDHPRIGISGGEIGIDQLTEFLGILLRVEFLNPDKPPMVAIQVRPAPHEQAEIVITNMKRALSRAWALV